MAKFCVRCKFHKRMPIQQGQQAMMIPVCVKEDFGDPVTGEAMPCIQVRQIKEMCGLDGKGFVQAEEAPKEKGDPPKLIIGG